ncbi:hypothetical protein J4H39_03195 [Vibrio alginolyticus]|uniref:hypothetical protein n=1 Tax=Vibrio alginolyticus TaxID=663 RepID=UPI001BD30AE4|nr:hypothetical protein [Vibrio alginolyticus]MBS9996294.1 hypothetical protein [Vibrio alginolyticus]HCG6550222.1 hypothetical protein [Vibrio parahaemolyticus]
MFNNLKAFLPQGSLFALFIQSAGIDLSAESELPFSCCHTALLLLSENQYRSAFLVSDSGSHHT